MMTYETYKDSGIEWLGNVPEHWETKRVKDLFTQISLSSSEIPNNGYVPLENIESLTGKIIRRSSNENGESASLFKANDILFNKLRPYLGKVFIPDFDGGVSGEVVVFRCSNSLWKNRVSTRYYFYRFLSTKFIFKVNSLSDGVKMPRTNPAKISNLEVGLPPLPEQQAIALYLDAKTQAIDKKVSLLEQKIDYYKELRKSLINDLVTGKCILSESGLIRLEDEQDLKSKSKSRTSYHQANQDSDKKWQTKDSGVDWIGQIPEHWEVKRFKSFGRTVKGKNLEVFDKSFDNALPNLSLDYLRNDEATFPAYCYSPNKSLRANENDILIVWDGAAVGEMIKAKEGFISSTIAKFEFDKSYSSRFYQYLGDQIHYTLKSIPTGMGIPHLNPTILNNFMCPTPLIEEQIEIAEYLDHKTTTIDKIVQNITDQIDRLKELRKALINDVVTGKIRVCEPELKEQTL